MQASTRALWLLPALSTLACAKGEYGIGRLVDAGGEPAELCEREYPRALVCSGFEDPALGDWGAPMLEGSGALARVTSRAHSGQASLHATTHGPMSVAVLAKSFAARSSGALFWRAYVYLPAAVPTQIINIAYLGTEPSDAAFPGLDFNLQEGALQIYSSASEPARQTGDRKLARDRWVCMRARVDLSESMGAVQMYLDDELALDATGIDTSPTRGLSQFRAGVGWSSDQAARFEIYIDDVVVDTSPVACR